MVFWLNPSHIVYIERIQKNLTFVLLLTEIYTLLCLWRIRRIRQDSLCVFSMYAQILSAHSPSTFKYFPRIRRRFCVPQITLICHVLHIRLNTFHVFSEYAQILSAHSPQVLKYFPRILCARRKNEEQAERIFHHQQCLGTSKGKCFEKIEWGVICLPRMNSLQSIFFGYL